MQRLMSLIVLVGVVGALPAQADGFADYSGRDLYTRFCAACHGDFGRGDGRVGKALAVVVPDLTTLAERQGGRVNVEQLMAVIDGRTVVLAHGTRYMPVWGYEFWVDAGADEAAEEEVRIIMSRLVDYLASIQR